MPNLKLSVLLLSCGLLAACNSSSSRTDNSGSGGGMGAETAVTTLFSASPDAEPVALNVGTLADALNMTFGSADDEPKDVNAAEDLTALLPQ